MNPTTSIHAPQTKKIRLQNSITMASIDDMEKHLEDLVLKEVSATGRELGKGAYGKVFTVNYMGKAYAAKEIHSILVESSEKLLYKNFLRECYYCSKLDHHNIVDFKGIYHLSTPSKIENSLPIMVMELMDESLTEYVKKERLDKETKFSILCDVSSGLSYLHDKQPMPIIHRDLSPNNILLKLCKQKPWPVAKISDLGVAKVVKTDRTVLTKAPGTTDFMPPEALRDRPHYDTSLDIFSYAGIILHVVNQEWPTPLESVLRNHDNNNPLHVLSECQRRKEHLNKMSGVDKVLKPLVEACLDNKPSNRPATGTVLNIMDFLMVSLVWYIIIAPNFR